MRGEEREEWGRGEGERGGRKRKWKRPMEREWMCVELGEGK